ncbi:uncharacterized protein GGS25DRAFT_523786 [Hypoxylon fragiforme]|uniref:uncharacterized protein n=1 Tax=Hypoxylon fragiforme TaxID=63214 RepID=UPI0020C735C1|nr:uncharacterized protein GGS25DRAFT_523786 [Hypoxylon fragiforme]KAI2606120.1 hypothetical protein GGS25DRAFT_523786 [Hypoxylon fragiforme]
MACMVPFCDNPRASQHQHRNRRQQQHSNYRGDLNLRANSGDDVPESENTNLWITNLPNSITHRRFLSAIHNVGRVRSLVIHNSGSRRGTAAAALSFFRRPASELFKSQCDRRLIQFDGRVPRVVWNRHKVEQTNEGVLSRVLLIAGDPEIVNRRCLDEFFATRFTYDIDRIIPHGTVETETGPVARFEYRFGSWRGQAVLGFYAIQNELYGRVLTEYGMDPCS